MQFRILGPVEAVHDGQAVALGRRRDRAVLGILLLDPGVVVPTDVLVELLWAGDPPSQARAAVHAHMSRLRRVLRGAADVRLRTTGGGYLLDTDPDRVDAAQFRHVVASADAEPDTGRRLELLRRALALWRGEPLAGAIDPDVRARLCADLLELHRRAQEDRLAALIDLGAHDDAIGDLGGLVSRHPHEERPHALLMRALHRAGRGIEALEVFGRYRAALVEQLGIEPGELLQAEQRAVLGAEPHLDTTRVAAAGVPTPRELPAAVPELIGRDAELQTMDGLLNATEAGATGPIVLSGPAGVGKTTLAVHWAQRVAHRFGDGQLYVDLRGFSDGVDPVDPVEVCRQFLLTLGIPPTQIPAHPVALYRSVLAERRVLLVLDNARDAEQVRPLLPGVGPSLVLVTSRHQLAPLIATDVARPLLVQLLDADDAHRLLAARFGGARMASEPDAAVGIVRLCAGLPLALALVAARVMVRPEFSLAAIADEFAGADLDAFGDERTGLRAVLSSSYRAVGADAARLLRLLSLHPGPTIGVDTAASLAAASPREARGALSELADMNLIGEVAPGRFVLHDLVRAFAADHARTAEAPDGRSAAVRRLFGHYLHSGYRADRLLGLERDPIDLPAVDDGVTVTEPATAADARRWFDQEGDALLAAVRAADHRGEPGLVWRLAWVCATFLLLGGRSTDMVAVQLTALRAARSLGDDAAAALAHRLLGRAYAQMGESAAGEEHFRSALAHYAAVDDGAAEATVRLGLAFVAEQRGAFAEAVTHALRAVDLLRGTDQTTPLAMALNVVGWANANLGDYPRALRYAGEALELAERISNQAAQAAALDTVGFAHHRRGEFHDAVPCFRRAYELNASIGYRSNEADVLMHLGDSLAGVGDHEEAREVWEQALVIMESVGHPWTDDVRRRLSRDG